MFSAAEAALRGVDPAQLRAALRRGELVHVRRGAYAARSAWDGAGDEGRYLLKVLAIARTLHPRSGAEVVVRSGVPVVTPARAVVHTVLTMGRDCAVVAGDAALHRGLVTYDELLTEGAALSPHQGRGRAFEAVSAMDGKCESVGESRTRLALVDLGFRPESQVVITDSSGVFIARVDFVVEGVVIEFDGRIKYARARDPEDGVADAGQVVWLEKRREDAIRHRGHPVERVIWSELSGPGLIGARVRAARGLGVTRGRGVVGEGGGTHRLGPWPPASRSSTCTPTRP